MPDSNGRLALDLAILLEMAGQMEDYLRSETLFWPMQYSDMPKLTLGGFWLRQHRLTALHTLLTAEQLAQLSTAIKQFETAVSDWVVRTEQRAHETKAISYAVFCLKKKKNYTTHPSYTPTISHCH